MRRIHIIGQSLPGDGYLHGTIAFWADTPTTMVEADTTRKSQVPWATAAELTALQNGTVSEVVQTGKIPVGATTAQIEQQLVADLSAVQQQLTASAPSARYVGGYYDDTAPGAWTNMPA